MADEKRILFIESTKAGSAELSTELAAVGFDCATISREEVVSALRVDGLAALDFDIFIIDLRSDLEKGTDVIAKLSRVATTSFILVLVSDQTSKTRISMLELGADDVLSGTVIVAELVAHCRALARRKREKVLNSILRVGTLFVDVTNQVVERDGESVQLNPNEFALLVLLMRKVGHTVTKEEIYAEIWKSKIPPQTNIVDVLICRLRNKVHGGKSNAAIQTIHGAGYVLELLNDHYKS